MCCIKWSTHLKSILPIFFLLWLQDNLIKWLACILFLLAALMQNFLLPFSKQCKHESLTWEIQERWNARDSDIILLLLKDLRLKPALLTNRNLIKENGKFKGNYPVMKLAMSLTQKIGYLAIVIIIPNNICKRSRKEEWTRIILFSS